MLRSIARRRGKEGRGEGKNAEFPRKWHKLGVPPIHWFDAPNCKWMDVLVLDIYTVDIEIDIDTYSSNVGRWTR